MRALLLAVLFVLAGCTAPVQPGTTGTPTGTAATGTPTDSLSTPQGACEAVTTPTVSGDEFDTKRYPDPPESRSAESVGSYVREYERAYQHNAWIDDRTTYIEVYATVRNVSRHGDSYVVRLTSYTNGGYEKQESEEGTPIEVHWDGAPEHVAYLVTDRRLIRVEGDHQVTPPSTSFPDGETMACF